MKSIGIADLIISIGMFTTICGAIIMLVFLLLNNNMVSTFGNLLLYTGILIMVSGFLIPILKIKDKR